MKLRLAPVTLAVATLIASTLLVPSAANAAPVTKARADRVSVVSGSSAVAKVLSNDKIRGSKKKARIVVLSTVRIKVKVVKVKGVRALKVTPRKFTKPGTYKVTYRVRGTKGKFSKSKLTVKVSAKPTPAPADDTFAALVSTLKVAPEHTGAPAYDRGDYKHWNVGLNSSDGCDTRREVLIIEAVVSPTLGARCSFTGGTWFSYYDGVTTTDASKFDLDHMVALKEAHDSGAWAWNSSRREAYANDQGDSRSLIAVSASSNRSKSDRDVAEWLPPAAGATCRYVSEWVVVKVRWTLSVDPAEKKALDNLAAGECSTTKVAPVTVVR